MHHKICMSSTLNVQYINHIPYCISNVCFETKITLSIYPINIAKFFANFINIPFGFFCRLRENTRKLVNVLNRISNRIVFVANRFVSHSFYRCATLYIESRVSRHTYSLGFCPFVFSRLTRGSGCRRLNSFVRPHRIWLWECTTTRRPTHGGNNAANKRWV